MIWYIYHLDEVKLIQDETIHFHSSLRPLIVLINCYINCRGLENRSGQGIAQSMDEVKLITRRSKTH